MPGLWRGPPSAHPLVGSVFSPSAARPNPPLHGSADQAPGPVRASAPPSATTPHHPPSVRRRASPVGATRWTSCSHRSAVGPGGMVPGRLRAAQNAQPAPHRPPSMPRQPMMPMPSRNVSFLAAYVPITSVHKRSLHSADSRAMNSRAMHDARPRLETREEVMFFDTDCGAVVHNLAYLRMIETLPHPPRRADGHGHARNDVFRRL